MITSTSNGKVKQIVQWQSKAKERRKDGIFLAEGVKMFGEAPVDWILEVYVSTKLLAQLSQETAIYEKLQKVGFEEVTEEVFSKISDTQTPQGILTVMRQPVYQLSQLLNAENPLLVVLEDLQDPGNLGTIIRTGEGAGITGVIMSKQTVDIFNPKVIRATMGSVYRVPFVYVEDLVETMNLLHQQGIHTYAAHLQGKEYYDSFSFNQSTAFLIGNEGNGLSRQVADAAEHYLKIPMEGQVESLNAAVATALLMYEAHRQRANK